MKVAQTIQSVASGNHPLLSVILDRRKNIDMTFVRQVMSLGQFSWHGRRPMATVDKHGNSRETDLDLLSILVELQRRHAHIELPGYDNRLAWKITADEQHVGTKRYGPIVTLISHKEHLSFSVRIYDESIVRTGEIFARGAERTYMMVNQNGEWHQGWKGLTWQHSPDEQEFFDKRHILPQNAQLRFKYYVHPNRRQSIFSQAYLLMKLLLARLEQEVLFYSSELSRLSGAGVQIPKDCEPKERSVLARGKTRNEFVVSFKVKLEGLAFKGNYPKLPISEDGYRTAYLRHKELVERLQPTLQFVVRADEAAFYRYGYENGFTPWWIDGPKWQQGTIRGKRSIVLFKNLQLKSSVELVPIAVAAD